MKASAFKKDEIVVVKTSATMGAAGSFNIGVMFEIIDGKAIARHCVVNKKNVKIKEIKNARKKSKSTSKIH